MIIADTSGLLAFFDRSEPTHAAVRDVVDRYDGHLVVSPFVIAELDYQLAIRVGVTEELAALDELAGGAYVLPGFDGKDLGRARAVIHRYRDQEIGVADASIVVLAERYSTRRVLTVDRRHFEELGPLSGGRFSILP